MKTQTLDRYTATDSANAFFMKRGELEGIVNSNFDKVVVLDTNLLLNNNIFYDRATRNDLTLNEKVWDNLLDPTSNVYTTGVVVSEALSKLKDKVIGKFQEYEGSLQKKVLKSHDKRIPKEISHKNIGFDEKRNVLDAVENEFSDMSFPLDYKSTGRHYGRAVEHFDSARNSEDKSEGVFRYFMTLAVDATNDIFDGSKDQSNVIYDAYNLAMSLLIAEEAAEKSKDINVHFLARDGDIEKIVNGMFKKVEDREKLATSDSERNLIEKFYDATDELYVGHDETSLGKYLMNN